MESLIAIVLGVLTIGIIYKILVAPPISEMRVDLVNMRADFERCQKSFNELHRRYASLESANIILLLELGERYEGLATNVIQHMSEDAIERYKILKGIRKGRKANPPSPPLK